MYGSIPIVSDACGLKEIASYVPYDCKVSVRESEPFVFIPNLESMAEKMVQVLELSEEKRREISYKAKANALRNHNFLTTSVQWARLIESSVAKKGL